MSDIVAFSPVRAIDLNGDPVPGARAFFFRSGTTTPITVYTDVAEVTPHPVPVEADANGVFPPVYRSGEALRVLVTSPDGVTLPGFPIDPVITVAAGGGAAAQISFEPTSEIPVTNVQAAIERVQLNLVAPLLAGGIGVTGNADILPNVDATNTASGFYRFTDTATGTLPAGWAGETGIIYVLRETATNAVQVAFRRDIQASFRRRLENGTWEAWERDDRGADLTQGQIEDDTSTVFGLISGERWKQAFDEHEQQIGVAQTWQNVLSSRNADTWYANFTGKPIQVLLHLRSASGPNRNEVQVAVAPSGTPITIAFLPLPGDPYDTVSFTLPNGWRYRIVGSIQAMSGRAWSELRSV